MPLRVLIMSNFLAMSPSRVTLIDTSFRWGFFCSILTLFVYKSIYGFCHNNDTANSCRIGDEMVQMSIIQQDGESEEVERILIVLARANSPAPLGYISLHAGIKEPLGILRRMEERGLIRRSPCSQGLVPLWSCCIDPLFEIAAQKWEGKFTADFFWAMEPLAHWNVAILVSNCIVQGSRPSAIW